MLHNAARSVYTYLFFTRNSFFQIFYLFLVVTLHVCIINDGLGVLMHVDPDTNHLLIPFVILGINFTVFLVCCYSDPGVITKDNVDAYVGMYPYDEQMYKEGVQCVTCHVVKPARSKHCSVYNRCVFKFDHYCVWIRNCVGGLNHRYFLLLLLSLTVMCVYGSYATFKILRALTEVFNFWNTPYLASDGQKQPMNLIVLVKILCTRFPRLMVIECGLVILCFVVGYFTLYHLTFAISNETTNERYKRHAIKKSGSFVQRSIYDKGIWRNFCEEVFPRDNETCNRYSRFIKNE